MSRTDLAMQPCKYCCKRDNNDNKRNKKIVFKNNVPFRSCISKINNAFIDNAKDFDIVIPMYNFLEYSDDIRDLWNYYSDEINDEENEADANKNMVYNNKTRTIKYFKVQDKKIGNTPNNGNRLNADVVFPI